MRLALVLVACLLIAPPAARAEVCGPAPEPACATAHGEYRLVLPDGARHPPAIVFLHGWGGSAEGTMREPGT